MILDSVWGGVQVVTTSWKDGWKRYRLVFKDIDDNFKIVLADQHLPMRRNVERAFKKTRSSVESGITVNLTRPEILKYTVYRKPQLLDGLCRLFR